VGRNGIGKTTLLKHIANFEIEGFPRHHRVLHVKQEVRSSEQSVLQVVLESDIERTQLMNRYHELLAKQDAMDDSEVAANEDLIEELTVLQDRMDQIGAESAEVKVYSWYYIIVKVINVL
jgi:ATP-binding cassette subfamily F protein 3